MASNATGRTDDAPGIRYVYYVTAGWLLATAIAIAILLFVLPSLF